MDEIKEIVGRLCQFKSRPVNTADWAAIKRVFDDAIPETINSRSQAFKTPAHFLQILTWIIGGFLLCLILVDVLPWLALICSFVLLIFAVLYFDWRRSAITKFPPLLECRNYIAANQPQSPEARIILMAHWDSAPITFPYRPSMIRGFRTSVFSGLIFMSLVIVVVGLSSAGIQLPLLFWAKAILVLYFLIQLYVIYVDFWKHGYSNGANDNASGCAAAISCANRLWKQSPGVAIELCITGAEEVGMIGSRHYFDSIKSTYLPVYVINFDTVGCEHLQVITRSGTFSVNSYEGPLLEEAQKVARDQDFPVNFAKYETADVDTVWFARGGVPSLTLISHNEEGLPAYIHRPEDTIDKLHWSSVQNASDFAFEICQSIIQKNSYG